MEREHEHAVFIYCTAVALGVIAAALGFYLALPFILIGAVLIETGCRR